MVGPERPQIVLFGSSIVQLSFSHGGWGAILADLYARKADILLRGYSGWNSRRALQVLEKVFPKDGTIQPSLVIVYFGGNDSVQPHPSGLGQHVPLPEYVENMKKIAIYLKDLSKKTRILILSAPPINEELITQIYRSSKAEHTIISTRSNELCREYSDACLEMCKEMGIKSVDLWTSIQKVKDWRTACFLDGIHFTSEASKVVAKEIIKAVKEADWEPSLHYDSLPTEFGEDSPYDPIAIDGTSTWNVSKGNNDGLLSWGIKFDD